MITQIIAHAGEEHSDVAEAVSHFAPSYIAIPLFFVVMGIIGYLTWLVSGKKLDTVLIVLAICMLNYWFYSIYDFSDCERLFNNYRHRFSWSISIYWSCRY
jgi:hypothetical protein